MRYLLNQSNRTVKLTMGTLVCLNVPRGTTLGCDLRSWTIGERFTGISDLPPGLRFVHFTTGHGLSQGFFFRTAPDHVTIRAWSEKEESFLPTSGLTPQQEERCLNELRHGNLRSGMGKYPRADLHRWEGVASYISEPLLQHCMIRVNIIISPGDLRAIDEATAGGDQRMVPFFEDAMQTARFTFIPDVAATKHRKLREKLAKRPHLAELLSDPQKTTAMAQDASRMLDAVLRVDYEGNEELFLGELQLAFVLFMYIGAYEALEQWKRMLHLVCNCSLLQSSRPGLFVNVVAVLMRQLEFAPKDLFAEELFAENFLIEALSRLVCESNEERNAELQRMIKQLEQFLEKRFGTKLLETMRAVEAAKDDPVVVEEALEAAGAVVTEGDKEGDDLTVEGYTLVDTIPDTESSTNQKKKLQRMEWMLPSDPAAP